MVYIKRNENAEVNDLAQMAYGYRILKELAKFIITKAKILYSIENRVMIITADLTNDLGMYIDQEDWGRPFVDYLKNPIAEDKNLKDRQ